MTEMDDAPTPEEELPPKNRRIALFWLQFGPYHMDRSEALAAALGNDCMVFGVEYAASSREYAWASTGGGSSFTKRTLFPHSKVEEVSRLRGFFKLLNTLLSTGAHHVFLCNMDRVHILATAICMRLCGRRVYAMSASKFDDRERSAWRELAKKLFYFPYHGVLAGSARTESYMKFLGFRARNVVGGYDTVSIGRVRSLVAAPPAPGGRAYGERHFTIVARLVAKKNIGLAIDAYRRYRDEAGAEARALVIVGSGDEEADLRRRSEGVAGIEFRGFRQQEDVAAALADTLALILPSREEQWGLVVNEALAMGVPVLVSDVAGARDSLVRTAVNGYVFEPDNALGLARLMARIAGDEDEWRRLCAGANELAPRGDAARFAEGVRALTGL